MATNDAFVLAVTDRQTGRSYWAAYVYPGSGAQPLAEAIMLGLAQTLPSTAVVNLVAAQQPTRLVASEPGSAGSSALAPLVRLGGSLQDWLSGFTQRWAANWWRR